MNRLSSCYARSVLAVVVGLAGGAFTPPTLAAPRELPVDPDYTESEVLRLREAAGAWRIGDPRRVVEALEPLNFTSPGFAEADRAAFLLAQAYHALGSETRFLALARAVSRWPDSSAYIRALARQAWWMDGALDSTPGARDTFRLWQAAAAAEPDGALAAWRAALEADSAATPAALEHLAMADTTSILGRDLAGAARVRRAALALDTADSARWLAGVPAGSRLASRAGHLEGMAAWERGDTATARGTLERLLADSLYAARREVQLALAGLSMEAGDWQQARRHYEGADADWHAHRAALESLARGAGAGGLEPWDRDDLSVLALDNAPLHASARAAALGATDLRTRDEVRLAVPEGWRDAGRRWPVDPPDAASRRLLLDLGREAAEAGFAVAQARDAVDEERARLALRAAYFDFGRDELVRESATLAERSAQLDSLHRRVTEIDARLQAARDTAAARVARRTAVLLAAAERHQAWIGGLHFFHVDGPHRERPRPVPTGYPGADSLLVAESRLLAAVRGTLEGLATGTTERLALSYVHRWRPDLVDRSAQLVGEAGRLRDWAALLAPAIERERAGSGTSPELLAAEQRLIARRAIEDSLRVACAALRDEVARDAVARTVARMQSEREGIDYGLAVSAYSGAVAMGAGVESAGTGMVPGDSEGPEAAAQRAGTLAALEGFLATHPGSSARGEMRFRLADLRLVDARQRYRASMAHYLEAQARGVAVRLPVLEIGPILGLYRAILAEDPGFPQRDAVLFNAGMILADAGEADAAAFFDSLVVGHPGSPYAQESHLRLGDLRFAARAFDAAVEQYTRCATGPDPNLRAVAGYKMGWAHYNAERFAEAAAAFGGVLDLLAARPEGLHVDVEGEATADLVQALARAGGAGAYARHFDQVGARPYALPILQALGEYLRGYSLHAEAVAADTLSLARFPLAPEVLVSAERMIATLRRDGRPADALRALENLAPRFAPGSPWAGAQSPDSVREAGARYARDAWTELAHHHHRRARDGGSPEAWQAALGMYRTLLRQWPEDAGGHVTRLEAGEAAAALGLHAEALDLYAGAARSAIDSVASRALWQRVAVTDAWYGSARAGAATGPDSLARALLQAGDELLDRFPAIAERARVRWRQGHVAFAHGWYERAAGDLERLVAQSGDDENAPHAAALQAEALFRLERFEAAGRSFGEAASRARAAGIDSLARRAEAAQPVCAFRRAEAAVADDSTAFARHADLFQAVATGWPGYEHAPLAQYRAGLAQRRARQWPMAITAFQQLLRDHPSSEFVRDARLEIAAVHERAGDSLAAAGAYAEFAVRHPGDEQAGGAWLRAADLFEHGGQPDRARAQRVAYLDAFPADSTGAMEVLGDLARADLDTVNGSRPLSSVLPAPPARGPRPGVAEYPLVEYLRRAAARPDLAANELLARVRFLEGEEQAAACAAAPLRLPLEKSIPVRQQRLDAAMRAYRQAIEHGVAEWAHAAGFRMGEILVAFGRALEASERPADLQGDDLLAYEDVVLDRAEAFFQRAETVWSELLRERGVTTDDPWIARARSALYERLADRFFFHPEAEHPRIDLGRVGEWTAEGREETDRATEVPR